MIIAIFLLELRIKKEVDFMKIKRRFMLFFVFFTLGITIIIGLMSLYFIKYEIELFKNAPNKAFISIMADKLFFKSLFGFIGLLFTITIISIIIGMYLFRQISQSFMDTVQQITGLAENRFNKNTKMSESEILRKYIDLLIDDQKKLGDFEKISAWKNGARLLIHEIKNPLTPLKLSIESLILSDKTEIKEDVLSAQLSIIDIENILNNFKDLVNIDYKPLYLFDFVPFIENLKLQLSRTYGELNMNVNPGPHKIMIHSEPNLLKMLITNLINNGMEAHSKGFTVSLKEKPNSLELLFITTNRNIQDIERCFIMGFSQKGKDRGYGLYLCKKIAEYLDIAIKGKNDNNNVVFTLRIKMEDLNE